jgi:hypothetical protein
MTKRYGEKAMEPFRHPDHPRPVTRRQFLAQGFISGAAMVTAPSLLGFFGRTQAAHAQAVDCGIGLGPAGRVPFIVFDLGGGASTAGSNVLVGTNTQLDVLTESGYMKLGLPLDMTPLADPATVDTELGLAFHNTSPMLRGIRSRTSLATRAQVDGAIFCARSDNDTGNNPHNPMYGIAQADADGSLVTLIGTQSSDSGGRSDAPGSQFDPTIRPTKVDRPSDATGLVDTGKLVQILDPADASAVMTAAQKISDRKVEKLSESALVNQLIQCAFRETTDLVTNFGDPNALDPLADTRIVGIDGSSIFLQSELAQSEFRKTASVMKLVVEGFAGAGTIEFGGYDYHDSTRATGERKDEIAGEAIGAALEYAARVGTPLVVYVLSDGSVASNGELDNSVEGAGKGIWKSDNSGTASTFMLVYDPTARPTVLNHQIGRFRDSGSVETGANAIADNVSLLSEAIVMNYLALHGELGRFGADVIPGSSLAGDVAALTAFGTLPSILNPPIP